MTFGGERRLIGGGVLGIALLLGGLALSITRAQDDSRRELQERFDLRGALAARFGESYVSSLVASERARAERLLSRRKVDASAFEAVVTSFDFEAAVLLDDRGRLLHVWPRAPELIGASLTTKYPHLAAALDGRVGISPVVPSAVRGTAVVAFATPFQAKHGRRVFSGAFAVERTPFAEYLETAVPFASSALYVVDGDGKIVLASETGGSTLDAHDSALAAAAAKEPRGVYRGDDRDWYFTSHDVAGTPWRVIAAVPERELLAPIAGSSRMLPWLLFAVVTLAALGVLILVLRAARARARLADLNAVLEARNDELRELDRLKDEFVALVSHELRTPLTSIIGYVRFLLRDRAGEIPPDQRRYLTIVERNSQRLVALVGDLLFAAKADAGRLTLETEHVALDRILADVVESARVVAGAKDVELALEGDSDVFLNGDRARLSQLFENLVSNAIKFTPEDGRVVVRVVARDRSARVEVEDSGIGIPEDELGNLFERFFRASTATEREIQGSGLGLSVARTIAELHDGSIHVESRVGVGTLVSVELPRTNAPALAA